MPAHAATPPDPAGGPGCGMVWRVCAHCPHIDEHHLTDHELTDHELADHELADPVPGRRQVAGPAVPGVGVSGVAA